MTFVRIRWGINKWGINNTKGRHDERPKQVRRCVAVGLADDAGQPSRISWLDLPGDFVRPKFSNIWFDSVPTE